MSVCQVLLVLLLCATGPTPNTPLTPLTATPKPTSAVPPTPAQGPASRPTISPAPAPPASALPTTSQPPAAPAKPTLTLYQPPVLPAGPPGDTGVAPPRVPPADSFPSAQHSAQPTEPARLLYRVTGAFTTSGEGAWNTPAVDPAAGRLYIPRDDGVVVADTATGRAAGFIQTTPGSHHVTLGTAIGRGFISNARTGKVDVFDLQSQHAELSLAGPVGATDMAFEPSSNSLFACAQNDGALTIFSLENGGRRQTLPLDGTPSAIAAVSDGRVLVALSDTGELLRINALTLTVESRHAIDPGWRPIAMVADDSHNRAAFICTQQRIIVVETTSGRVLMRRTLDASAQALAFDAVSGSLIAACENGSAILLSTDNSNPLGTLHTFDIPRNSRTMVLDPRSKRLYFPTAEFDPAQPAGSERRVTPGSFRVVTASPMPGPAAVAGTPTDQPR